MTEANLAAVDHQPDFLTGGDDPFQESYGYRPIPLPDPDTAVVQPATEPLDLNGQFSPALDLLATRLRCTERLAKIPVINQARVLSRVTRSFGRSCFIRSNQL